MAVVITPFRHQVIPIMSNFSLDIEISGNPSHVSVDGKLKGFAYHWNASQNRIELSGTPDKFADNVDVIVTADDQVFTGTFSIVPVAPVIGELTRQIVRRGVSITIPIPITGHVSKLEIEGPWIGLKYRQTSEGAELYGVINASAEFTTREFRYNIEAYNQNVFDTAILEVELALGS